MDDTMLKICIEQGYVPMDCKLDGMLVWHLIQDYKNPCDGCNADCVHKISNDNWEYNTRVQIIRKTEPRYDICPMLYVDTDRNKVYIDLIDANNHKAYYYTCGIEESFCYIKEISTKYKTKIVIIQLNGYGQYIYEELNGKYNLDVIPLMSKRLKI